MTLGRLNEPPSNEWADIDQDPEFYFGLTMYGKAVSVQVRDSYIALSLHDDAPRSNEVGDPVAIPMEDARRLRDLLNVATARGML
jgi:hypothetical protein